MIVCRLNVIHLLFKHFVSVVSRGLSSAPVLLSKHWREERGLSLNRNAEGILTDAPDFTYLDGRPTPLLVTIKFITIFIHISKLLLFTSDGPADLCFLLSLDLPKFI